MEYLYKPHFYAHILSSIAIMIAMGMLILNYRKICKMKVIELINLFAVLTIATAAYGQSYTTLEKTYGYDPISVIFK